MEKWGTLRSADYRKLFFKNLFSKIRVNGFWGFLRNLKFFWGEVHDISFYENLAATTAKENAYSMRGKASSDFAKKIKELRKKKFNKTRFPRLF
ncbi:MAG: hypothetical protein PHP37_00230 [Patescibacteria group bacterium]|nr:hypothetical protein [Patescibacteria group bacterium]